MSKERLRIGIVGAGANTRLRHIPGFQEIDGVEIVTVCNRSEASSRTVAEDFGIARIAGDWREVVDDPEVDAVCIGTWPYLHAPITLAAVEAGKHVLTEARMAMHLSEAEAMAQAARAREDLVCQIVPAPFSLELDARIRALIDSGALGRVRALRTMHTMPAAALAHAPLGWRMDDRLSGINMLTLGIFHEMTMRWIEGNPSWVRADGRVFTEQRTDPETGESRRVRIPEYLDVWGAYADGPRLTYHFSAIESGPGVMETRIHGSEASLRVDYAGPALYRAEAGSTQEQLVEIPESERVGWRVEADFVASIREGKPVRLTNFSEGVRYMRFTQNVWDSVRQGGERIPW